MLPFGDCFDLGAYAFRVVLEGVPFRMGSESGDIDGSGFAAARFDCD